MLDESIILEKAREAVRRGPLPAIQRVTTWGGPGTCDACRICDDPVRSSEKEFAFEFVRDGDGHVDTFRLHVECFYAWLRAKADHARRP